jgi:hypothetical protein
LHAVNWNCKFSFDFLFLHVNEIVVSWCSESYFLQFMIPLWSSTLGARKEHARYPWKDLQMLSEKFQITLFPTNNANPTSNFYCLTLAPVPEIIQGTCPNSLQLPSIEGKACWYPFRLTPMHHALNYGSSSDWLPQLH